MYTSPISVSFVWMSSHGSLEVVELLGERVRKPGKTTNKADIATFREMKESGELWPGHSPRRQIPILCAKV